MKRMWCVHPRYLPDHILVESWKYCIKLQKDMIFGGVPRQEDPLLHELFQQDYPMEYLGDYLMSLLEEGRVRGIGFTLAEIHTSERNPNLTKFYIKTDELRTDFLTLRERATKEGAKTGAILGVKEEKGGSFNYLIALNPVFTLTPIAEESNDQES